MYLFSLIGVCVVHCERKIILQVFEGIQWVRLGLLLKPTPQKYTQIQILNTAGRDAAVAIKQTRGAGRHQNDKAIWPSYIIT